MKRDAKDWKKKSTNTQNKHGLDKFNIKRIPEIYQNKKPRDIHNWVKLKKK